MENIKFIFFDVGFTLIDEDKVWDQWCRDEAETFDAKIRMVSEDMIRDTISQAAIQGIPEYVSIITRFKLPHIVRYREEFETVYPQASRVLNSLSKKYKLGVIANTQRNMADCFERFGIAEYFSLFITSKEFGVSKPDRKLFYTALRKSGCKPDEVVMVGDRPDHDINPAKAVGMHTVRIHKGFTKDYTDPETANQPEYDINELEELLDIL